MHERSDDGDAASAEPPDRGASEAERLRWRLAVTAAAVGTFDWDLLTGRLDWDDELHRIFGLTREQFGATIDDFVAALHPDDVPRVAEALRIAIEACSEYAAEYRILRPDGTVRWVQARGRALAGPDGTAARIVGAAYDTTERREDDARLSRVLESMPAAFFLVDDEWRFTYVNAEAERLLGRTRIELVGGSLWELFPAGAASAFEEAYRGAAADGNPRAFEAHYPARVDRWFDVRAWPGPDGLSVYLYDCTDRHEAQEDARRARQVAERAQRRAEADQERLRLLADVGEDLVSTHDIEEAVARLTHHLVPRLASWCLITRSDDRLHLRDIGSWHADPAWRPAVARYASLRVRALEPTSYLHRALRTGEVVTVRDATRAVAAVLASGEAVDVLRELAPHTAYAVPLRAHGRTVGAMTLFLDADRPELAPDDIALVVQLADRAGLALDNDRLYEEQRSMAWSLQRALLSEPATPDRLEIALRYVPASRAAQVGGDWYDAFLQPRGGTMLVIGDVVGHDTQATAEMSQVRTLVRGIGYTSSAGPRQVLLDLEDTMHGLGLETMATAIVARLEQPDRSADGGPLATVLRWSSAGHPPPLVAAPDGKVELLQPAANGPMLGLGRRAERPEHAAALEQGSTLLLYSDGLVERRGEHLADGLDRLKQVVTRLLEPGSSASTSMQQFVDDLLAAMEHGRREDDVAVVAVRVGPDAH